MKLQAIGWPGYTLMSLWQIFHALVGKFLNALAFIGFGRVDVVFGVSRNAVWRIELSWLTTATTETDEYIHGFAIQYINLEVLAIC